LKIMADQTKPPPDVAEAAAKVQAWLDSQKQPATPQPTT
jgi:hypothetical protein